MTLQDDKGTPCVAVSPDGSTLYTLAHNSTATEVGLPCVSLLGSQLAPEDLIGVPQIVDGKSRFCPPLLSARE